MALKRLTAGVMISLSDPWVTPGTDEHTFLTTNKDTAPVQQRIASAHAGILAMQPLASDTSALGKLQVQAAQLDARHDDLVRGAYSIFQGVICLTTDPARREALTLLRDAVFPSGVAITQKAFREEAGQAQLLKGRLSAPQKALLKSIPVPDGNLLKTVEQYIAVAAKLGKVEDQKTGLMEGGITGADSMKARNAWVRAVNRLVVTLEDEETLAPVAVQLLARLRAAEDDADRRAANDSDHEDGASPPAPPPTAAAPAASVTPS